MIARLILSELVSGVFSLPVWWYTRGLSLVSIWCRESIRNASQMFGIGVWVKNLFVPMYGETEWSGRLISFGIRAIMIVVRGLAVALWSVVAVFAFVLYVSVLPLAIIGVIYHGPLALLFNAM